MTRPQRIILHVGFHRTGTTSVQQCLHENGPLIWPTTALGLRWKMKDLLQTSRDFSTWRDPFTLEKFALRFAAFLEGLALAPSRKLVISAEELAGHLPGRQDVADYGALPMLMAKAVEVMEAQYPQGLNLTFYLSTRDADPWLDSAWADHVKISRMVLDRAAFCSTFAAAAELDAIARRLADAVAPHEVMVHRLEDICDLPLGPAEPLINLIDLPSAARQRIQPARPRNARLPDAVLEEMLALNRSDMSAKALRDAKKAVLSRAATG